MNIYKLVGRNLEVTDAMRTYAEEKLAKLDRVSDQIVDASVVMSFDTKEDAANPATVEVQVNLPNGIIRAEERAQDTYAAIDLVVDKLDRQLKRFKGRLLARRQEAAPPPPDAGPAGAGDEEAEGEEPDESPRIVRVKRHVLRPMAPEDAALQMEALGHTFFVFHNVDTDLISVIYRRRDGDYGLIEPAQG
ncbi:MAG TPA: ribosome-associated translation inhibitor RaiA [Trueperaceae bacterium]|jgi:putative sigma-54 modulation protein|nr:ribosome-associated translation inhibitor RaiA [Trueperaceae bacterium]